MFELSNQLRSVFFSGNVAQLVQSGSLEPEVHKRNSGFQIRNSFEQTTSGFVRLSPEAELLKKLQPLRPKVDVKKQRRQYIKRDKAKIDSLPPKTNLSENNSTSNLTSTTTLEDRPVSNYLAASKGATSLTTSQTPKKTASQINQNCETATTSDSTVVAESLNQVLPASPFKSRKNAFKSKAPIKNNRNSLSMPIFFQVSS